LASKQKYYYENYGRKIKNGE
jgi:malate synthase